MRHNLPVTNIEHFMGDDEIIVSTTDLKGRITSVNEAFIHLSGFTEDELMGQAHNIVRHPDMPESAFQDLWDTLQAGEPWTGVVKNRCKNGDYYWVVANAAPIMENGKIASYLSVRTKPTAEQIQTASVLYADVNAGKTTLGKISILKKLNVFNRLKVWQEIVGVVLVSVLMFGAALYEASTALVTANDGLAMSNNDRNVALTAAKSDGILQFEKTLLLKTLVQEPVPFEDDIEIIENDIVALNENLEVLKLADLGADEREAADAFTEEVDIYINEVLKPSIRALQQADMAALTSLLHEKIIDVDYDASSQALLALQVQLQSVSEEEFEIATVEVARVEQLALILVISALILVTILAWHVTSTLRKRMAYAIKMLDRVSEGHYFDWVEVDQHDEIGAMLLALKAMQIRQGYRVTEMQVLSDNALRIKDALDTSAGNVMLADANYNIFYTNSSMQKLLKKHEVALKEALPNFNADQLIGTNIDIFYKDPAHQRRILDALKGPYDSGDLNINDVWVRIIATPVFNEAGERVAVSTEWEDRTGQIKVERELESFMKAAVSGDLSQRMETANKQGFFLTASEQLNRLGDVLEGVFTDIHAALRALENSDLTHRIDKEYMGTYDEIKQAANNSAEKLADIMNDMRSSAMNVADGSSEISNGNATLSDRTQEQAASLEETSASVEEITGTVQQNADNARQANQLAVSTSEQAQKGSLVASQAVEAMAGISGSSKKIADIIGVIDEIAFQTNLLALNAAVEAARAGEQGRGFAVVASEVRTLAGRSAEAAKEIKELINASVESVAHGSKLVDDSGAALSDIVASVQKVTDIIAEIAAASQEQSAGIDQVNKAITQLDSAVQQNAALVEETAASSANMDQEAGDMLALVDVFNTGSQTVAKKVKKAAPIKKAPAYKPAAKSVSKEASRSASKPAAAPAQAPSSDDAWEEF